MSYYSLRGPRIRQNKKERKKKVAEIHHSRIRALTRYNVQLTPELRQQIISAIQKSKPTATFLEKRTNRVSLWEVQIGGYPTMPVLYDKKTHEIITILHSISKRKEEDR